MSFSRARKQDFSNLFKTKFIFFWGGGEGGKGWGELGERETKKSMFNYIIFILSVVS